jgi:hypothetical protein
MTQYYSGNAVVAMVRARNMAPPFYAPDDRAWDLVYGNSETRPLLLVSAKGMSAAELPNATGTLPPTPTPLRTVGELTGIPHLAICFDDQSTNIVSVHALSPRLGISAWSELPLASLALVFARAGLPVSAGSSDKAINSQSSSAFHDWQRHSLGANLVVSDCDLWLLGNGTIAAVLELKRSFYDFDQWQPFPADFPNFKLLFNLLNPMRIPLFLAYNRRTKEPFNDDPNQILMFRMDFSCVPPYRRLGVLSADDFLTGRFLTIE